MFRRLTALLLITALLGGSLSRSVVAVGFQLNKHYITNVFCENKFKPELHCNGRCYLAKKAKEVDESEKKGMAKLTQNMSQFISLQPDDNVRLSERTYFIISTSKRAFIKPNYFLIVTSFCFRPPRLS